jgi:hypothetical protein
MIFWISFTAAFRRWQARRRASHAELADILDGKGGVTID